MRTAAARSHSRRCAPPPQLLHPTPHTLHPTPYTIHLTPYTLHPTPYTLHHTPYTLHPTPYTLHPTPYTLHPTPYTRHPTTHTLHPTPDAGADPRTHLRLIDFCITQLQARESQKRDRRTPKPQTPNTRHEPQTATHET